MSGIDDSTLENQDGELIGDASDVTDYGTDTGSDLDGADANASDDFALLDDQEDLLLEDGSGSEPDKDKGDSVQKVINRKHYQVKRAEERFAAEQERRRAAEQKLYELQNQVKPPEKVPPIPDTLDPDYESKMATRDRIIKENTAYEYHQHLTQMEQQNITQQSQQAANEQILQSVNNFHQNATKLKMDVATLQESDRVVSMYVKDPFVCKYLLDDPNGPVIVDYLANNLSEMDDLLQRTPQQQIIHLSSTVAKKALSGVQTKRKAPAPLNNPSGRRGGGSVSGASFEDQALNGATIE